MAGQGNDPLFQTLYTALGKMEVKPSELKSVINTTQDFLWLKVIFPLPSSSLPLSSSSLPLFLPLPPHSSSFLFPSFLCLLLPFLFIFPPPSSSLPSFASSFLFPPPPSLFLSFFLCLLPPLPIDFYSLLFRERDITISLLHYPSLSYS